MIKNRLQFKVTMSAVTKFEDAIEAMVAEAPEGDPELHEMQLSALNSQLSDLQSQIEEFRALESMSVSTISFESIDQLPSALIKARIASGLTQGDLAARLGMKTQQIQRYEATDYESISFKNIVRIAEVMNLTLPEQLLVIDDRVDVSSFMSRLNATGFTDEFIEERLAPPGFNDDAEERIRRRQSIKIAERVGRILAKPVTEVLFGSGEKLTAQLSSGVRYKLPANVDSKSIDAYSVYVHYLALTLLDSGVLQSEFRSIDDPYALRALIIQDHGEVNFTAVIETLWGLGVGIMPLSDVGKFHAAIFTNENRRMIALKQRNRSLARWSFDVLHEYWHGVETEAEGDTAVIEHDDHSDDDSERTANQFASAVLLGPEADDMAAEAITRSGNSVPKLKTAVIRVASERDTDVAVLANYLAHRLSDSGTDWWGVASSLQVKTPDPFQVCRSALISRIQYPEIAPDDYKLLLLAIHD